MTDDCTGGRLRGRSRGRGKGREGQRWLGLRRAASNFCGMHSIDTRRTNIQRGPFVSWELPTRFRERGHV